MSLPSHGDFRPTHKGPLHLIDFTAIRDRTWLPHTAKPAAKKNNTQGIHPRPPFKPALSHETQILKTSGSIPIIRPNFSPKNPHPPPPPQTHPNPSNQKNKPLGIPAPGCCHPPSAARPPPPAARPPAHCARVSGVSALEWREDASRRIGHGSRLNHQGTADVSQCFHLSRCHFVTTFLTHSQFIPHALAFESAWIASCHCSFLFSKNRSQQ